MKRLTSSAFILMGGLLSCMTTADVLARWYSDAVLSGVSAATLLAMGAILKREVSR